MCVYAHARAFKIDLYVCKNNFYYIKFAAFNQNCIIIFFMMVYNQQSYSNS